MSLSGKTPVQVIDESVLYEELENCSCFKFIAFKELRMPFRHTGFLLFFDNVPKYTINVRTEDDSWSHWLQSLVVAPGRTTVESAESLGNVKYVGRPVVHVLNSDEERAAARSDLKTMLEPKRWYSLLWQNCRNHVQGIMGRLDDRHPGLRDAGHRELQQIYAEDWTLFTLIGLLVMIPIAVVLKR
ncbi:uncharacterized protein LOC122370725 isoform X1 [Amphibalanus amphitrite]|nr:uncharacterized protein LOC122370725 isoform X1 [Amphibalanus amphitrite]XP_043202519.1 uncharacterized protein LOC122370725 isoform X1 [Amphibalanus amphitrite]XP_043202520.1 uncharacterized protein LOC122370725 isoform X1 [Amphibalanus amphitrite]